MTNGSSLRMDKDQNQVTEKILRLTLEIIYLLTGEDYTVVRKAKDDITDCKASSVSGGVSISDLTLHSLKHNRNNGKMILEVTNKIIELLTEEWEEYLEGQKDLCSDDTLGEQQLLKDVKMSQQEPIRSLEETGNQEEKGMESESKECKSIITERGTVIEFAPSPLGESSDEEIVLTQLTDEESKEPTECVSVATNEEEDEEEEEEEEEDSDFDGPEEIAESEYSPIEIRAQSITSDDEQDESEEEAYETVYISEDGTTVASGDKLSVMTCSLCGEDFAGKPQETSKPLKCLTCSALDNNLDRLWMWSKDTQRIGFLTIPKMSNTTDNKRASKNNSCEGQSEKDISKFQHGDKTLICEVCGRYFAQQASLDIHRRIHTGEKPFICLKCGKGFRSKGNLVSHQTVHTDDKQFQCPVCEKYFKRSLGLIEHMRLHTGEKPFTCHDCGKSFSQRSAFSTHQKIHADGKVFTCFDCGRCFKSKADLRTHELVHLGDKPFQCTECGEGFTRRANLLRHQRTHSGVKPFSCPKCGKTFTRKLGLLKHERLHMREKAQAIFEASMSLASSQECSSIFLE
ncbi:gastrula zinc finger protein XlCGF48.2-like [Hyperolius riggenbachi]|uniref:gastrula zinc finger protein XlCGF48.2-like n=1 Tax=Hyperolius riggenbachi TaxID=752182 RepID=UPI0035A35D11